MDPDPTALTDIHSHLVPGVDDGARDLTDTLEAVERMTLAGIRRIVTTPHLDGSLSLDPQALEERLDEVTRGFDTAAAAVRDVYPEVEMRRGHEVMLDVPDVDLSDPRMRLAGTRFVLVEWPRLSLPPGTNKVLHRIVGQGWVPVVAHPERYVGMDLEVADRWKAAGALLQVNFASLEGRYGREAKVMAYRLLRRGWVDYLASDFHARPDRGLYLDEARRRLAAEGAEEAFHALTLTNPGRILRDEMPIPVAPLPPERGVWARMKGILGPGRE